MTKKILRAEDMLRTEVLTFRLEGKDEKWLTEYAKRIGMRRSTFLRGLVTLVIKELQKEPLPEQVKKKPPPPGFDTPPSPKNTTFWQRYKSMIKRSIGTAKARYPEEDIEASRGQHKKGEGSWHKKEV